MVSRAGVGAAQIGDIVAEAQRAAAESSPAEDAADLPGPADGVTFGQVSVAAQAGTTRLAGPRSGCCAASPGRSARRSAWRPAGGRRLYGFAEHTMTSLFLGSSTGLRLRHDQPSGKVELNAKTADLTRSAWAGAGTRDFTDVDVAGLESSLARQLGWASPAGGAAGGPLRDAAAARRPSPTCSSTCTGRAGAKDAVDGRTVFSKPGGGTRIGERLASVPVTLRSDPGAPGLSARRS